MTLDTLETEVRAALHKHDVSQKNGIVTARHDRTRFDFDLRDHRICMKVYVDGKELSSVRSDWSVQLIISRYIGDCMRAIQSVPSETFRIVADRLQFLATRTGTAQNPADATNPMTVLIRRDDIRAIEKTPTGSMRIFDTSTRMFDVVVPKDTDPDAFHSIIFNWWLGFTE